MSWNSEWDTIFSENQWGEYPTEELVRFVARNFYKAKDRSAVRLLEIGCGPGANLWFLAKENFSVVGLDGSAVALANAKKRLNSQGIDIPLLQADARQLPFPEAYFDGVFDIECLYANSLLETRRIIAEVHRVLKPGGLFFSKTFMVGSDGDGQGALLAGEPHTYTQVKSSTIRTNGGIIRFTAESEISELYGSFSSIDYDYLIRSDQNRKTEIKEWLISCKK